MLLNLSTLDKNALSAIYRFRCLTPKQVYEHYYQNMYTSFYEFVSDKLADAWIPLGLVELQKSNRQHVLFLTNEGIRLVVDHLALPTDTVESNGRISKGYRTAAMLRLNEKLFNHQIHLNEFVFQLLDELNTNYPELPVRYEDEKHISHYSFIRPDGLLRLLDVDIFIEMDMGTESRAQLEKKWEKYRQFLTSPRRDGLERNLVVLFACEGVPDVERRKALVRQTIFDQISGLITKEVDLYIGSTDELLTLFKSSLLPEWATPQLLKPDWYDTLINQDIQVGRTSGKTDLFQAIPHATYAYFLKQSMPDGSTKKTKGLRHEWFFDDYRTKPMSVLSTLAFHESNNSQFHYHLGRRFHYVVLVEDEATLIQELEHLNLLGLHLVYFTTLKRLQEKPFEQAIFMVAEDGRVFSFESFGGKRIYEGELLP